ncbi:unnamed protein product [Acanthoscelides obtectus]|uniref:Uncharacterized protein n=1 Tax=Acanthoscelides obtectus TaxID=200917 RepID=A0A9P0PL83_ACAOB|nr:unnamed protein product [Acanthoscelides obtectus]CAK1626253.1 hypothetical protein AOBTE_LOCUS3718 [Acanthoscelides obtectus]
MHEYALRKFPSCSSLCSVYKHGYEEYPCCRGCLSRKSKSKRNYLLRHESSVELYNLLQGQNSVPVDEGQKEGESYTPIPSAYNGFQTFHSYTLMPNSAPNSKACLCESIEPMVGEEMNEAPLAVSPMAVPPKKEKINCCALFKKKKRMNRCETSIKNGIMDRKPMKGIMSEGKGDDANREIRIVLCSGTCESSSATNTAATASAAASMIFSPNNDRMRETTNSAPSKYQQEKRDQINQSPKDKRHLSDALTQTSLVNDDSKTGSSRATFARKQSFGIGTGRKCNCQEQLEVLKMLIKMEAKQNYRLISNIMKELSYQREEVHRLTNLYEDELSGSRRRDDIFGSDLCVCEVKCKCKKCSGKSNNKHVKDMLNRSVKSDSFDHSETSENKKDGLSVYSMYSQETPAKNMIVKNCSKTVFCVQDEVTNVESSKERRENTECNCTCPTVERKSVSFVPEPELNQGEEKKKESSSCPMLRKVLHLLNFRRRSSVIPVN